jgi:hypothetical protein
MKNLLRMFFRRQSARTFENVLFFLLIRDEMPSGYFLVHGVITLQSIKIIQIRAMLFFAVAKRLSKRCLLIDSDVKEYLRGVAKCEEKCDVKMDRKIGNEN